MKNTNIRENNFKTYYKMVLKKAYTNVRENVYTICILHIPYMFILSRESMLLPDDVKTVSRNAHMK